MRTCKWPGAEQCGNVATILQRYAIDRPVGEWGTDRPPRHFEPDITPLCEEHARLGLFAMADEYREWTMAQLQTINCKVQRIIDVALSVGFMPEGEQARLDELVNRHAALVAEARDFIRRIELQESGQW